MVTNFISGLVILGLNYIIEKEEVTGNVLHVYLNDDVADEHAEKLQSLGFYIEHRSVVCYTMNWQ